MTREEQVKICASCSQHKHDIHKGIVCKITGEHATFTTTCPDYDKSVEESVQNQLRLRASSASMCSGQYRLVLFLP